MSSGGGANDNGGARRLALPGGYLELGGRTLIMGVINVTPDSFSDGGRFLGAGEATEQGKRLLAAGADLLDIGGESTRPGSDPTGLQEEMDRVLPVISRLASEEGAVISIDTYKPQVAREAMAAGASIINDVTAMTADPQMLEAAVQSRAAVILMHMQGKPRDMQKDPHYDDVVAEVTSYLKARVRAAVEAGVNPQSIMVDPGIGFGKTMEHNLLLIRNLKALRNSGAPVLLGASRKAFIGLITGRPVDERVWGTVGAHVAGALFGADMVRVHDVAPVREAVLVSDAIARAGDG